MPDEEDMKKHRDKIQNLSESLWAGMKRMFEEEGVIHAVEFKPLINQIDELVGDLYDLDTDEVEFLKEYHAEYGRGLDDSDSASLDDFLEEEECGEVVTDD
ncbi:hypothetical protein [Halorussus marinus]|uniref:hypothetical protein n=1 Tax=Halorussus marinus TaxID=2505976 RepID=UPI00106DD5C0|nr:hypothetical protein [Halorussus marinus]